MTSRAFVLGASGAALAATALVGGAAVIMLGPRALILPVAAAAGYAFVLRPPLALVALVGTAVIAEGADFGLFRFTAHVYQRLPHTQIAAIDLLFVALLAGIVASWTRSDIDVRLPKPFTLPLLLLMAATLGSIVVGSLAGGDSVYTLNTARTLVLLAVIPFLAVNALSGAALATAVAVVAALAAVKAVEGLAAWLLGAGRAIYGTTLTYYAPLPNWLMLLLILGVLAAFVARMRLPLWAIAGAAVAVAALVLSFRRNFWIAALLGIPIALVVARGTAARRLAVPLVAAGAAAAVAATLWGSSAQQSSVLRRAESLSPTQLQATSTDRYRIDEQRNVIAEIRRSPLIGLGLGVPWSTRTALSEEHPGGHQYSHVVATWYWLKLGLPGLVAYLWLMGAGVFVAARIARRHQDPLVRVGGAALAAGLAGLVVAETTGSFTGIEPRLTVVLATAFGWLAAAARDIRAPS